MADFWATMRKQLEQGLIDTERVLERANEGRVEKATHRHTNGRRHGFLSTQLAWGAKRRGQ